MECSVTVHDRIGRIQLAGAVTPLRVDALHALLESAITETVRAALDDGEFEIELTLCGDAEMERLNFDHMGERGPTDVLAFPLHEWSVNGRHSRLAVDDGIGPPGPMLLGVVDNASDRQIAEVRAREVTGVFEVENGLTVAR